MNESQHPVVCKPKLCNFIADSILFKLPGYAMKIIEDPVYIYVSFFKTVNFSAINFQHGMDSVEKTIFFQLIIAMVNNMMNSPKIRFHSTNLHQHCPIYE